MPKPKNPTNPKKTPWPTKDAMTQVYHKHLWGGQEFAFYSGEGSRLPEIVNPYLKAVTTFLTSFKSKMILCDLGCGDFNVGKALVKYTKNYIAIDIVPDLIAHNKRRFKDDNLEFQCLDIAVDDLPVGDCVLLRQVLQHLSNDEIQAIAHKLSNYNYVIVTEHLPQGDFTPNLNIISGQATRLKKQSGVDLLAPPFNLKVKDERELCRVFLEGKKGVIRTVVYEM